MKKRKPKYPELADYNQLKQLLICNSQRDIAMLLGCGVDTVNVWVKKHKLNPPKKKGFTKEQLESMLKTLSLTEIAEKYEITKQAVRQRAIKFGVNTFKNLKSPLRNIEYFLNLHVDQKLTFTEIAQLHKTNVGFVSKTAKELGIKCQTITEPIDVDINKLIKLYQSGLSPVSIAKKLKFNPSLIRRKLEKSGIKIRNYYESIEISTKLTKDTLEKTIEDQKTVPEIAKEMNVTKRAVRNAFTTKGLMPFAKINYLPEELSNADKLYNLYWKEKKSAVKIADEYKCTPDTIYRALLKYNIRVRTIEEASKRTSKYNELNDPLWLRNQYEFQELSAAEIAELLNCSIGNVIYHLKKYDIKVRDKFEANLLATKKTIERYGGIALAFYGFKCIIETSKGGTIQCRSKTEADFAISLDKDPDVITFEKEYPIEYFDRRGHKRIYMVDFFVRKSNSEEELIEVKHKNILKWKAPDTSRMIKQVRIGTEYAKHNNMIFKMNNKLGSDIMDNLTDQDLYYAHSYFDHFAVSDKLVDFFMRVGFMGVKLSRSNLFKGLRNIKAIPPSLNANHPCKHGLWFMRHFHQHYFKSYHKSFSSIEEAFSQKSILKTVISKAYNDSALYKFDIYDLINIISRLIRDSKMLSLFKPWIASYIYDKYLQNGNRIFDPCCGWGGRALGTIDRNIHYIGYDLNEYSIKANRELYKFGKTTMGKCEFHHKDSASQWDVKNIDLIFTSPPYDDTEIYSGIENYKSNKKLLPDIIEQAYYTLNKEGYLIINIPRRSEKDCLQIAQQHFKLIDTLKMDTASIMRKATYEPILVFQKI